MRSIKRILRQNVLSCFLIYLTKYRVIRPIQYYIKYVQIKRHKCHKNMELEKLHNTHKNEVCIIIGNGPSVKISDLELIANSNIDSFGANRIVDLLDKTNWCPTYISVMDPSFLIGVSNTTTVSEYLNCINQSPIKYAFLTDTLERFSLKRFESKKVLYVNSPLANLYSKTIMPFSADASKYISDMGNVTHYSIQLATYIGYSTIYLYGMDNTYIKYLDSDEKFHVDSSRQSHIDGLLKNIDDLVSEKVPQSKFEAFMIGGFADKLKNDIGYMECRKYADFNGIKIINLTHGGALDFFERQNFYEVFNKYELL